MKTGVILPNRTLTTNWWTNMKIEVDSIVNIPGALWDSMGEDKNVKEARRQVLLRQGRFAFKVWDV